MSTSQEIKNVVLIGASGTLGAILLTGLLASKAFNVTVLTRKSSDASQPPNVTGQDAVISAVGATGFQTQILFIDAAIKAGVKRFIPSEFSTNTQSEAVRELVPVFQAKKTVLDYLKGKESSGLTWTGLSVGAILDWGLKNGFLGFDLPQKKALIWDEGMTNFSANNEEDIGIAISSILRNPVETANKYLYISTITTNQKSVLASLEAQTGEKWISEEIMTDKQISQGRKMVSGGDFAGMLILAQASMWSTYPGIRSNYAADEKLSNAELGLPDRNLAETVKGVACSLE